jgi:hypothetical protein
MEENMINPIDPVENDKFEVSFRLLGNELFAMQLVSASRKRNWIVFGLLALILVTILAERMIPLIMMLQGVAS